MGEKADFLMGEGLISTAFLGGVWSAIQVNPESAILRALGQVLAEVAGPATANSYLAFANLVFAIGTVTVVIGVYAIGQKIGLIAFGVMWLSGFLIAQGINAGAYLLLVGWGLGAVAVLVHTDESISPPAGPVR